jgi:ATP-dependent DNA helicase RecG
MLRNLPIEELQSVGPKRAEVLRAEAGISTIEDLIYYAPRRYLDRSSFVKISDCADGQQITVAGTVSSVHTEGRGRKILCVEINDGTEDLTGVFFGGIQYFQRVFDRGDTVVFSGTIASFRGRKQIVHPEFDFYDDDQTELLNTGRIIPLYHSNDKLQHAGFSSRGFRKIIFQTIKDHLDKVEDPLPTELRNRLSLVGYAAALKAIHFPENLAQVEEARIRLAFNELFFLQYYLHLSRRLIRETETRPSRIPDMTFLMDLFNNLPFTLTEDQKQAVNRISQDIAQPFEMNRLLQGDVGSGKTAVAMAAACIEKGLGHQTAIMAPTEVLAAQHFSTFQKFMPQGLTCGLLVSGMKAAQKKKILTEIASGSIDITIGTHALIQDGVAFKDLGLVIVDEQHRFGVEQRAELRRKGEKTDLLVMTATPIPRSLALTAYGDLDVTVIKKKPADRLPIKTLLLPESRMKGVNASLDKYMAEGRQCYYILPLIEESEKSDLVSAKEIFEELSAEVFTHRRIGLLHGKMKAAEKEAVMNSFKEGNIDLLVSTTVIEVGIDVPNATVIVIRHPERFGLSQLHQLRGRVGRGPYQSFCILLYPDSISKEAAERLGVIEKSEDGFAIAEQDLRIRGAGDFLGTRQHGVESQFEFADLSRDLDLLLEARSEAEQIIMNIKDIKAEHQRFEQRYVKSEELNGSRITKSLSLIS